MSEPNGPTAPRFSSLTAIVSRVIDKWIPDAFVIALILTAITMAMAIGVAGTSVEETVLLWGDGFWSLLAFSNQLALTLLFGYALAHTAPFVRLLTWIASVPKKASHAYALVAVISCVASLISWSFCLVAGALMARRVATVSSERGIRVHYPLLVACGFVGIAVWHQGLSSSIGLSIATPGHPVEHLIGVIPTSQTLFTTWNLISALIIVAIIPVVMAMLAPKSKDIIELKEATPDAEELLPNQSQTDDKQAAWHLENSRLIILFVVGIGGFYLFSHFTSRGGGLDLNTLNLIFLILALACSGRPSVFISLIQDAAKVLLPILLQYPFYAGIAGIMAGSGIAEMIVAWFISISDADTLPIVTFFSAGILNIFIPSGGAQWVVQGPVAMEAAMEVGADIPRTAMAIAMGDQWTNLIQPLVALPALAVAGLQLRDIMGYCLIALLFTGAAFLGILILF